jgi:superfamily II DNA or RNA helicase
MGGPTELWNGQALCEDCNLRKGVRVANDLRPWQRDALMKLQATPGDFLLEACPGAGKTRWAIEAAKLLLSYGSVARVVVVTPTVHLKGQWVNEAHLGGLELRSQYDSQWATPEPDEFQGMVTTYQQVCYSAREFAVHAAQKATLVIFDEIHHAADDTDTRYGEALRVAFGRTARRIAMSGTPFRTDATPIPFVHYDEAGVCQPDFTYGYEQALDGGVVRPLVFPMFDGPIRWLFDGAEVTASFSDELSQADESRRLRTALTSEEGFLETFRSANDHLTEVRGEQLPTAGGLVLCIDQQHAYQVAEWIRRATGDVPAVAVSDQPDSDDTIAAFRTNHRKWLVAVRMVSEGVDIPRLSVLVYWTNVVSELFFRQATGRIIRTLGLEDEPPGYCYLPADPRLASHAEKIKQEVARQIDRDLEMATAERGERLMKEQMALFTPIGADLEHSRTILDGSTINDGFLEMARRAQRGVATLRNVDINALARFLEIAGLASSPPAEEPTVRQPLENTVAAEKRRLVRLVNSHCRRSGRSQKDANADLAKLYTYREQMTLAQVLAAQQTVKQWLIA